jgi:hypothetical protein
MASPLLDGSYSIPDFVSKIGPLDKIGLFPEYVIPPNKL